MTEMIVTRTRELSSLITTTGGAENAPVRSRRLTLDRERSTYGGNASRTEGMLSDVEAAVEELRNEVVERRFVKTSFSRGVAQLSLALYRVADHLLH